MIMTAAAEPTKPGSKLMSTQRLSFPLRRQQRPDKLLTVRLRDITGPITVIEVAGELDMSTRHLLTDSIATVLATHRPLVVILDLAAVRFFCADGIRALLHVRDAAAACATQLILRNPSPAVVKVLTITSMLDAFNIKTGTGNTGHN
jgi:anti-sigma B factor antagonist